MSLSQGVRWTSHAENCAKVADLKEWHTAMPPGFQGVGGQVNSLMSCVTPKKLAKRHNRLFLKSKYKASHDYPFCIVAAGP